MKKNYASFFSALFITGIIGFLFFSLMPRWTAEEEEPFAEFSTKRALQHIKAIAQKPHYVGSNNHDNVANYLVQELRNLGLTTSTQQGYTLNDNGLLVQSKNILARIKGSNSDKALVLLSHYDSAPHSYSPGASDAGSGVATILESVRAFLYAKTPHKNDIIILFTDAEELGLNGAALFATQHQWAKEVGLVLNFEARGSSGPSYMLMETTAGNEGMVKAFAEAKTKYPVSNSLMYSIYKMLPNDTDLTVFREQGKIQGFNFAFIDDHFYYHTAQDDVAHLNQNTLAHQGTYLTPLLNYFSNANLEATKSTHDEVYFSIPYTFIHYPFSWNIPLVVFAAIWLAFLLFIGKAKRLFSFREIAKGCIPLFGSLLTAGLLTFLGWKSLLLLYPQYNDLLNGFTYNGHDYIAAFMALTLAISFTFYHFFSERKITMNHLVAPLFLWLIINFAVVFFLPGAGFLIIPVYFALLALTAFVVTQKSRITLNVLLSIPALLLLVPFIQMFPVGLGLKLLFGSAILTVLTFVLLLPVFGSYTKKGWWAILFYAVAIGFFAKADFNSSYELGKAKSNSLVYIYDADTKQTNWTTYDTNLDSWTKSIIGNQPTAASTNTINSLTSKYNSGFSYTAPAPKVALKEPSIVFLEDRIVGSKRYVALQITPNRKVNRYDIFANEKMKIYNFKANRTTESNNPTGEYRRKGSNLLRYYVVNNAPLVLKFNFDANIAFDMELLESSFDLMSNPLFEIPKRENWMMPTPFVLTDAVVIKQKIKVSPVAASPIVMPPKRPNIIMPKPQATLITEIIEKNINETN